MSRRTSQTFWWMLRLASASSVRVLGRAPSFSLGVLGCWIVGMFAAVTTLTVADVFFLRPPMHVPEPDRFFRLHGTGVIEGGHGLDITQFSYPQLEALRRSEIRADFAAYAVAAKRATANGASEVLRVAFVSDEYFDVARVRPVEGRLLTRSDPNSGALSILLSERSWRHLFGEERVSGSHTVAIGPYSFVVSGVLPDGFTGGEMTAIDAWVSLEDAGEIVKHKNWRTLDAWWLIIVGRLGDGAQASEIASGASTILQRQYELERLSFVSSPDIVATSVTPAAASSASPVGRAVRLVAAAGATLLLFSAVNVGGMFLLRGLGRQRELMIRHALGASRRLLVLESAFEVILLAVLATIAVVIGALLIGPLIIGRFAPSTAMAVSMLHSRTLLIALVTGTVAIALGVIIAAGQVVLVRTPRGNDSSRFSDTRAQNLWRAAVVAGQALATTVLVGGALTLTSHLTALRSIDLGLQIQDVIIVTASRGEMRRNPDEVRQLLTHVETELRRNGIVETASLAISAPFLSSVGVAINAADHPQVWQTKSGVPYLNVVESAYLPTTGMKMQRGRWFVSSDSIMRKRVAVINATFARIMGTDRDPIGRCINFGADTSTPCLEVVGVVRDARRFSLVPEEPAMQVYIPMWDHLVSKQFPASVLLVKTKSDVRDALPRVVRVLRQGGGHLDVAASSLETVVDPQIRPWRTAGALWTWFGAVALVLTGLGIYSAMAYVAQRARRQIAVRAALGAPQYRIIWTTCAQTFGACGAGLFCGFLFLIATRTHVADVLGSDVNVRIANTVAIAASLLVLLACFVSAIVPVARLAREPIVSLLQAE